VASRFEANFGRYYFKNPEDEPPKFIMYTAEDQMTLIHWEFVIKRHTPSCTTFRFTHRATMSNYAEALESLVKKVKFHRKQDPEKLWIQIGPQLVKENWKLIFEKLSSLILEKEGIDYLNFIESNISWEEIKDLWRLHDSGPEPKEFPIITLDFEFKEKMLKEQLEECLTKEKRSKEFLKKVVLGEENAVKVFNL